MSLNANSAMTPGAVYTFYYNPSGAILGMGYAPTGQELANAVASALPDVADVSGGISSTVDVYGPAWITFTYTGGGSATVGELAGTIGDALNAAFLTTSYAYESATEGNPTTSTASGLSSSTWILVGMALVIVGILAIWWFLP